MAETRTVNCRTVAGSFEVSQLYLRWTDRITIVGEDVSLLLTSGDSTEVAGNFMREVFIEAPEIPDVGDMHPVYPDCCCESVNVVPARGTTDSANGVQADVAWIAVRKNPNNKIVHAIHFDNFQQQEIRNFDINGIKTGVYYNAGSAVAAAASGLFPPYRIADIRVPRTMHGMRVTQYENLTGVSPGELAEFRQEESIFGNVRRRLPIYNTNAFLGFPKNTLLYLGRRVEYRGIPIARVEYSFLTNDRGWNKYTAVYTQQNGYVPKELDDLPSSVWNPSTDAPPNPQANQIGSSTLNGIGIFDMLDSADFSAFLFKIEDTSL